MRWAIITPEAPGPAINPGSLTITAGLRWIIRQADPAAEFSSVPMYHDAPQVWQQLPSTANFLVFAGNPRLTWNDGGQRFWDGPIYNRIDMAIKNGVRFIDAWLGAGYYWPIKRQTEMADEIHRSPRTQRVLKTHRRADLVIARDTLASQVLTKARIEHRTMPCCSWWAADEWAGIVPPPRPEADRTANLIVVAAAPPHEWIARRLRAIHEQMASEGPTRVILAKQEDHDWMKSRLANWNEIAEISSDPAILYTRYTQANKVLSLRIHATIPAARAGAQTCHIALDQRSQTLNLFGIPWTPYERLFHPLQFTPPPAAPDPSPAIAAFKDLL